MPSITLQTGTIKPQARLAKSRGLMGKKLAIPNMLRHRLGQGHGIGNCCWTGLANDMQLQRGRMTGFEKQEDEQDKCQ